MIGVRSGGFLRDTAPPQKVQGGGCLHVGKTTRQVPSLTSIAPHAAVSRDDLISDRSTGKLQLVCPICQRVPVNDSSDATLSCSSCHRTFGPRSGPIQRLTVTSGIDSDKKSFEKRGPNSVELFKNPFISSIYERGWRQGFAWAGFPGVDEEAKMAMDVLVPRCGGDIVVDMSCGSGLFTRKFLQSGLFSRVVAVDYSESMLEETYRLITEDVNLRESKTEYSLVQCDAARLAFPHASILGIHAGAAIHCWPDPLNAVAEMSRVLKPGGVFVGTTFLSYVSPLGEIVQNDDMFKALRPFEPTPANGFRWWNEDELRDLCLCCGFREFKVVERKFRYIMFAATK